MLPELDDCFLDHVAIATSDLENSVDIFTKLGLTFSKEREIVTEQKVKTAFAHIDTNAHIELLEPTSTESAIHKFIEKNGPGIHHLCFRVKDVIKKQEELIENGFRLIYPKPVTGAGNCLVNFIHPKSTGGILIEISQKNK
jgi:methylmalonyl-CoA epimerase